LHCISDNIIHIIIHIIKSRSINKCDKSGIDSSPQTVIKLIKLMLCLTFRGGGVRPNIF